VISGTLLKREMDPLYDGVNVIITPLLTPWFSRFSCFVFNDKVCSIMVNVTDTERNLIGYRKFIYGIPIVISFPKVYSFPVD
jgi:hypothetical protein